MMFSVTQYGVFVFVQLSRIIIESKTPTWHNTESLRMTRIKDERRGEILIFKVRDVVIHLDYHISVWLTVPTNCFVVIRCIFTCVCRYMHVCLHLSSPKCFASYLCDLVYFHLFISLFQPNLCFVKFSGFCLVSYLYLDLIAKPTCFL